MLSCPIAKTLTNSPANVDLMPAVVGGHLKVFAFVILPLSATAGTVSLRQIFGGTAIDRVSLPATGGILTFPGGLTWPEGYSLDANGVGLDGNCFVRVEAAYVKTGEI